MTKLMKAHRTPARTWNPFEDMDRDLGRLFGEWPVGRVAAEGAWLPAFDVEETKDAYILHADLPGMKKEDINISIQEDVVTISGERNREEKTDEENMHRIERSYGKFERSFTVRDGFQADKVDAHYDNGVLRITLPKRAERQPRNVEVRVS